MTIASAIQRAGLRVAPPLRAPCGHLHRTEGGFLRGSTVGTLLYIGRIRCNGSTTHVYARKETP